MAQVLHGYNWVVQLFPNNAASLVCSTELNSVSLKWDRANPDVSTFGTTSTVKRIAGLRDYSVDFGGIWSSGTTASAVTSVLATEMNASSFTYFLIAPASIAGSPTYGGCAMIGNLSITGNMSTATAIAFTLQAGTGSLTVGVAV